MAKLHKHGWKCPKVSFKTQASATTNIAGEGSTSPSTISGFGCPKTIEMAAKNGFDAVNDAVNECGIMGEHRMTVFSVIVGTCGTTLSPQLNKM